MKSNTWLLFDPYLASLGGGERYLFDLAEWVRVQGDRATIAGPNPPSRADLDRLGFPGSTGPRSLTKLGFVSASARFGTTACIANHPPLPSLARRSVVVVQFPFTGLSAHPVRRAIERAALRHSRCVVYSQFARNWVQSRWEVDASVVAPPVHLGVYEPGAKQSLILNVGRFFASQHCKRQDVLLDAYARLPEAIRRDWRLVLAGGVASDPTSQGYLVDIRRRAAGCGAEVVVDAPAAELASLYRRASLYWHATGFGRSAGEPEKAEHFGMTTVEAMSHGAVPMVFADGGQLEIVDDSLGVTWRTVDELVAATVVMTGDNDRRRQLAEQAVAASTQFGPASWQSALTEALA